MFKYLKTKKVIGYGRVDDGLYLLEVGFVGSGNTSEFKHGLVTIFKEVNQELLLWHHQIRHSSFVVPRKLFPALSKQSTTKTLYCDACELAKHTRATCSSTNNRNRKRFMVFHLDV